MLQLVKPAKQRQAHVLSSCCPSLHNIPSRLKDVKMFFYRNVNGAFLLVTFNVQERKKVRISACSSEYLYYSDSPCH